MIAGDLDRSAAANSRRFPRESSACCSSTGRLPLALASSAFLYSTIRASMSGSVLIIQGISHDIRRRSATMLSMEVAVRVHVEELPEGVFLATSDELPGLVAQGRTVAEALDIARDVARKLIEARREREEAPTLASAVDQQDYTIVVAA